VLSLLWVQGQIAVASVVNGAASLRTQGLDVIGI
jgi:hypothetical protein